MAIKLALPLVVATVAAGAIASTVSSGAQLGPGSSAGSAARSASSADATVARRDVPRRRAVRLVSKPDGVADVAPDRASFAGASIDGLRAFFTTRQRLVPSDRDSHRRDVYERTGGVTTLVSGATGRPDPDSGDAFFASASADGSQVFFTTAQRLTAEDRDNKRDVYERTGGITALISQPSGVPDAPPHEASKVAFRDASPDGIHVIFTTRQKLSSEDGDRHRLDVYERADGVTTLVSQPTGVLDPDSGPASYGGLTPDGSWVFFTSPQTLTVDDNDPGHNDLYARSRGVTSLVSAATGVTEPNEGSGFDSTSADGTHVFFTTAAKLSTDDHDDSWDIYERFGQVTTLVSQPTGVAPSPYGGSTVFGGVTADGRRVFFVTDDKLAPEDRDGGGRDVYERAGGTTRLLSGGVGPGDAYFAHASLDGRRVLLTTAGTRERGGRRVHEDHVYALANGHLTRITTPSPIADYPRDGYAGALFVGASADATRVFIRTPLRLARDDREPNRSREDVYMRNVEDVYMRTGKVTRLISKPQHSHEAASATVTVAFARGGTTAISAAGDRIFLQTRQRLTADDTDNRSDVFLAYLPRPTGSR